MKKISFLILLVALAASCTEKKENLTVEQKKKKLISYQTELQELKAKISSLEKQIEEEDPDFKAVNDKSVLVSVKSPVKKSFIHKVEVRGEVDSRKNVLIAPEIPGAIEKVHVEAGNIVKKGDKLVSLNSTVLKNNISEVKTSLELAEIVYEKQNRLWQQNIGTEIQYLQAKNNKEALQKRLNTLWAQLAQYTIKAPFSGRVDMVAAKVGEMAQPGMPLARLMKPDEMHIISDVSESFIGKIKEGDKVKLRIPGMDSIFTSHVTSIGQVISEQNRTFTVEYALPKFDLQVKPNLVVVIEITDYQNPDTFVIPSNIILKDPKGNYVFTVEKREDQLVAAKKHIQVGISYDGDTEVKSGIKGNERIIHDGFRDLVEGYIVKISEENKELTSK